MNTGTIYSFPAPAKINIFLHVVGRRQDGYHLLQSVMRLVDIGDTVHIEVRQDAVIHRRYGPEGVAVDDDLIVRAAKALQRHVGKPLGATIAVDKNIPMGAGMGGGSSDAATVLLALNKLWGCGLSRQALQEIALTLGADVPFFIFGRDAIMEGIGEQLQAIELPIEDYLIAVPPYPVATLAVFRHPTLKRHTPVMSRDEIIQAVNNNIDNGHPYQENRLQNDLQPTAERIEPRLLAWRIALQKHVETILKSPITMMMTGSGSGYFIRLSKGDWKNEEIPYNTPPFSGKRNGNGQAISSQDKESASSRQMPSLVDKLKAGLMITPPLLIETKTLGRHPLYDYACDE